MSTDIPLGKPTAYPTAYDASLLVGIPRAKGRQSLGLSAALPFVGVDIWNAYELSWLQADGKPVIAVGELRVPADSAQIVESKSLKLYLNSLNRKRFDDVAQVHACLTKDLAQVLGTEPGLRLSVGAAPPPWIRGEAPGECIDGEPLIPTKLEVDASLLACEAGDAIVEEQLHSHLLKSNCPVTSQPDWATLILSYRGRRLDRSRLLSYLVSFHEHDEFHEQCVERVFVDVMARCAPEQLSVSARYTRRGGIDINPFRSDRAQAAENLRLWRQ